MRRRKDFIMEKSIKREIVSTEKKGFTISDFILVAVLLAAGAVLKFFVGSVVNIAGMKPNFIIAMYCLAIILIKPKVYESAIIGALAGAVCQLFPGTPFINFASEIIGAVVMTLMMFIPLSIGKLDFKPAVSAFVATFASGSSYVVCLFLFAGASAESMVAYVPIVLCTALINTVIVQLLFIPLKAALKK